MILAKCFISEFTINDGEIVSSEKFLEDVFGLIYEPIPNAWEGDPDLVRYNRMKKYIPGCDIIKYIPTIIDESVVY